MAGGNNGATLRQVHRLFEEGTVSGLSGTQLLERFLARRDEVTFEALVSRHGPMVLGVCRRLLRDPHAIDDAFQATFLILVRKARALRAPQLLGPWLHGVAYRVALRSRTVAARRSSRETPYIESATVPDDDFSNDIRPVIDEELSRLPEPYRAALVLCYLEGHSHQEAAERLRCPVGTVRSRLARGREQLRHRLIRRGLAPAAGFLAAEVLARRASAAVPPVLLHSTVVAATRYAAGKLIVAGAISASAAALTQGVLTTMFLSKLQVVAVGVVILGLAGGSARFAAIHGALAAQAPDRPGVAEQPNEQPAPKDDLKLPQPPVPVVEPPKAPPGPESDLKLLQGVWKITEMVPNKLSDHWEIWKFQGSNLSMGLQKNFEDQRIAKHVRLDQKSSPKRMTILHPGAEENPKATVNAIYQLEGDQLRVLMASANEPFPTDISDRARALSIVFKRQSPLTREEQQASLAPRVVASVFSASLDRTKEHLQWSKAMHAKGYVSETQVRLAESEVQLATLAAEEAQAKAKASVTPGAAAPTAPVAPANAPPLSQPVNQNPPVPAVAPPEEPKLESMAAKALGLRLKAARKELERYEELYKRHSIPLAILEEMRSKVLIAEAQIDSEQERLSDELELMGPRLEVKRAEVRIAEAEFVPGSPDLRKAQIDVKKAELREVEVRMRQFQRKLDQIERLKKEVEPPKP